MDKKKTRKTRKSGAAASVKDLSLKTLSAKTARSVLGGVHTVDKSSPVLYQKCATGEHIKN
jgi:type VI protein secretion system component Hcp